MGQDVKASRRLKFIGDAKHYANVEGPMQMKKVHFIDHFTDDTLSTDKWLVTVTNGTIAVNHATYAGGMALITTDTTDNEASFLGGATCWEDDLNAIVEIRLLITDVSGVAVYAGFSDAALETTPNMPIDYADGTLAAAAANAVGFIVDADDSVNGVSSIVCVGVNATVLETAIDTEVDWADTKWHTLRVELNADGDATFFLDGDRKGFMTTAVTSGTKLCAIVAVANRDTGADTVYVDRIECWQDEES